MLEGLLVGFDASAQATVRTHRNAAREWWDSSLFDEKHPYAYKICRWKRTTRMLHTPQIPDAIMPELN